MSNLTLANELRTMTHRLLTMQLDWDIRTAYLERVRRDSTISPSERLSLEVEILNAYNNWQSRKS